MNNSITMHVGLDVHKDSIEIATADVGRRGSPCGPVRRGSVGAGRGAGAAAMSGCGDAGGVRSGSLRVRDLPAPSRTRDRVCGGGTVIDATPAG